MNYLMAAVMQTATVQPGAALLSTVRRVAVPRCIADPLLASDGKQ